MTPTDTKTDGFINPGLTSAVGANKEKNIPMTLNTIATIATSAVGNLCSITAVTVKKDEWNEAMTRDTIALKAMLLGAADVDEREQKTRTRDSLVHPGRASSRANTNVTREAVAEMTTEAYEHDQLDVEMRSSSLRRALAVALKALAEGA
ncbi:hypothetical protein PMIN01_12839 [Paraphaeosphaeria minitans]|uniref:Uncharacterized protein n=1 Tax=Paraphaeosphaeria minitans TaxID=565426 RepID=A0A9P6G570_9PLEO|nr:hypothetical protein PMIN01_12839 [Paraphaeosphaeria minitans]